MEKPKGADPKMIVAVQMFSIGLILLILGIATFALSPVKAMAPFIRLTFLVSMAAIMAVGAGFSVAGGILLRRARKT